MGVFYGCKIIVVKHKFNQLDKRHIVTQVSLRTYVRKSVHNLDGHAHLGGYAYVM